MKELKIFEGSGIRAGFTLKPERSTEKRYELAEKAREDGGVVLWPYLVHGTRIAICRALDGAPAAVPKAPDYVSLDDVPGLQRDADSAAVSDGLLHHSLSFEGTPLSTEEASNGAWTGGMCPEPALEWRAQNLLGIEASDGCITDQPGVVLTSTHGDCIPIYICDPEKRVVGLAHAGWRGTLDGIALVLAGSMMRHFGCDPSDLKAFIGPGIDLCCFEVGREVAEAFLDRYWWTEEMVALKPDGKYLVDLKAVSAELLKIIGIPEDNIEISPDCTYCDSENYYSWRRAKETDRMLAYICLEDSDV